MRLSIFDTDIFTYNYPHTIETLSEDIETRFSEGRYHTVNTIATHQSFILRYNSRLAAELRAHVRPLSYGCEIEIEINSNPTLTLIISGFIIYIVLVNSSNIIIPAVMFFFIFILLGIEYVFKLKLKEEFEQRLDLPTNNETIGHNFKMWW